MPPARGTIIGNYQIERLLGRGGMGEVYLATHQVLERRVALKLLAPAFAEDAEFRKRFLAESRLAASLDHPHVVTVYEAGESGGHLYLAMRFVEGEDLEARLSRAITLPPEQALPMLRGIASALDAAHERGLVHRDVKPGNILLAKPGTPSEHAYLADFGLVKRLDAPGQTRTGMFMGSALYVAPEQIEGGRIDRRADIYSLAAVAFHVLGGEPPYERVGEVAVLWAHVHAPVPRLSEVEPGLARFDEPLARGLAKDPAERQPTAGALISDLEAQLAATAQGAGKAARKPVYAVWRSRRARSLTGTAGLGALAAVVVVSVAVGNLLGGGDVSSPRPSPTLAAEASAQTSPTPVPSIPSVSIDPPAERPVPLGLPLEPGRYSTSLFLPQMKFEVTAGWTTIGARFGDAENGFDLARSGKPSDRVTILYSTTVSPTGCLEDRAPLRLGGDTIEPGATRLNVVGGITVIDELRADGLLGGDPWLDREGEPDYSPDFEKLLDKVGAQIDVTALRTPACSNPQAGVAILRRDAVGSGRLEADEWVIVPEGAWARIMPAPAGVVMEDIPGQLVIVVQSADRADFEAFLPVATGLLETAMLATSMGSPTE